MEQKKHKRCTKSQIRFLLNYMATHKSFANSNLSQCLSPMEASKKEKEWNALRAVLRKYGADKSVHQWKQTWRDLKRNMRKQKDSRMVETLSDNYVQTEYDNIEIEIDTIKHESCTEYINPRQSSNNGVGVLIKEEPSTYYFEFPSMNVNLNTRSSSPMQLLLTNTETSSTSVSTQTSPNTRSASIQTSFDHPFVCSHTASKPLTSFANTSPNPPVFASTSSNAPVSAQNSSKCPCPYNGNTFSNPSVCISSNHSIGSHNSSKCPCLNSISNPPPISAHGNFPATSATHHHAQCCNRNRLSNTCTESDNLLMQQNILLQNICNLLEEQNSILRIRNRIERNKIRYQHHLRKETRKF